MVSAAIAVVVIVLTTLALSLPYSPPLVVSPAADSAAMSQLVFLLASLGQAVPVAVASAVVCLAKLPALVEVRDLGRVTNSLSVSTVARFALSKSKFSRSIRSFPGLRMLCVK